MATNDRTDRNAKALKQVITRQRQVFPGTDNASLATMIQGAPEVLLLEIERKMGGRITGGEGAGPRG